MRPIRKVTASGAACAVTVVVVWALQRFWDVHIPGHVATAITTIVAFTIGYLVPAGTSRQ